LLFPLAATYDADLVWEQAGMLLVDVEPQCPVLYEALRILASHAYQPSDRLMPFYFSTQFGKRQLRVAVATVEAELLNTQQRQ
jgi:hypothetical protein